MQPETTPRLSPLAALIFSSRWLQLPLYLGLIVAQAIYVWQFGVELVHLIDQVFLGGHAAEVAANAAVPAEPEKSAEIVIMLIVLGLIDVVMISNLLVMVIVGGYETFVSRLGLSGHPDQPEWLSHVNASVLKVKLAMAIIGISSIHLLKTFIEAGTLGSGLPHCTSAEGIAAAAAATAAGLKGKACTNATEMGVLWQTIIHFAFILSAMGIAWTDKLMTGSASRREHAH